MNKLTPKPSFKIVDFMEASLPNEPYLVVDSQGRDVKVCPKNPYNHSSYFPLQDDPHVYRNIGLVIAYPDATRNSTSTTEKAVEARKEGAIVVYKKRNFYEAINSPSKIHFQITK